MENNSIFTTKAGLIALALLTFASIYFGLALAQTILLILLVLAILAPLVAKAASSKLDISMAQNEICAFPGQEFEVEYQLINNKYLPVIHLDMAMEESYAIEFDHAAIAWIMPFQKLSFNQKVKAVERGVAHVNTFDLVSSDAFGMYSNVSKYVSASNARMIVYPKIKRADASNLVNKMSELEKSKQGFYTDRTLLASVKPFTDGDDYKNVNQRLLAKNDELFTNIYEKLAARRICFIPDLESFVTRTEEIGANGSYVKVEFDKEGMEDMISEIASLSMDLIKKDIVTTLVVPSIGKQAHRVVIPQDIEFAARTILTALAEIEYNAEETSLPVSEMADELNMLGKPVLVSKPGAAALLSDTPAVAEALGILRYDKI
ncbi:MAG: DUF58 domain-containing protein [Clostridia bacterium]|nr:DUF58 domain-containing protein [Clostridia bacterium]